MNQPIHFKSEKPKALSQIINNYKSRGPIGLPFSFDRNWPVYSSLPVTQLIKWLLGNLWKWSKDCTVGSLVAGNLCPQNQITKTRVIWHKCKQRLHSNRNVTNNIYYMWSDVKVGHKAIMAKHMCATFALLDFIVLWASQMHLHVFLSINLVSSETYNQLNAEFVKNVSPDHFFCVRLWKLSSFKFLIFSFSFLLTSYQMGVEISKH